VPEASTLGRFRNQLVEHKLWDQLLNEINGQLAAKNSIMTKGRINIIDATPIEAAQSGPGKNVQGQAKRDPEAGWHVKKDSPIVSLSRDRFCTSLCKTDSLSPIGTNLSFWYLPSRIHTAPSIRRGSHLDARSLSVIVWLSWGFLILRRGYRGYGFLWISI